MVITNVNQVVYQGDGVTTAFPFTFTITDASEVYLQLVHEDDTGTAITQDFYVDVTNNTVHYPGYAPGSEPPEVNRPPKVQTGEKLVIYRDVPMTQEINLGDKWPFTQIEFGLDKLTMLCQQIYSYTNRKLDAALASMFQLAGIVTDSGKLQHITDQYNAIDENAAAAAESEAKALSYKNAAATSATNASNSASSASTTATQLMEFLATKEEITAPAVDPTLTISGAAADAQVTGVKIESISSRTKNLFDKTQATRGKLLSRDTGEPINSPSYFVSDFIPVVAGKTYWLTGANYYYSALYNTSKVYVSNLPNSPHWNITSNGYIRTSGLLTNLDNMQVEEGDSATEYTPYLTAKDDVARQKTEDNLGLINDITKVANMDVITALVNVLKNTAYINGNGQEVLQKLLDIVGYQSAIITNFVPRKYASATASTGYQSNGNRITTKTLYYVVNPDCEYILDFTFTTASKKWIIMDYLGEGALESIANNVDYTDYVRTSWEEIANNRYSFIPRDHKISGNNPVAVRVSFAFGDAHYDNISGSEITNYQMKWRTKL